MLKFHNKLSAFCNSGGLKEHYTSGPLCGSVFRLGSTIMGYFWTITGISESICSCWLLYSAPLRDRWRQYELIGCWNKWRALGPKTSLCLQATVTRLESSWDAPVYSAATFPATVSSHCGSLVQTGLKRDSDNKRNKTWARAKEKEREGAAELLPKEYHATASLMSKRCLPQF